MWNYSQIICGLCDVFVNQKLFRNKKFIKIEKWKKSQKRVLFNVGKPN